MWLFTLIRHSILSRKRKNISIGIAIIGITVGVVSLVSVVGIMNGMQGLLMRMLVRVEAYDYKGNITSPQTYREIQSVKEKLEKIQNVNIVSPFIDEFSIIQIQRRKTIKNTVLQIRAIEKEVMATDGMLLDALQIKNTGNLFPQPNSIIVGWYFAAKEGLQKGDTITIVFPGEGEGFIPIRQKFVISELFSTGFYYDSQWAFISLEDYSTIIAKAQKKKKSQLSGVQYGVRINKQEGFLGMPFTKHTEEQMKDVLDTIQSWKENNSTFYFALKTEKTVLVLLAAVIFGIIMLHFRFLMIRRIRGKKDDIVALRTMGVSPKKIQGWFFGETIFVGIVGITVGIIIGVIIVYYYGAVLYFIENTFKINVDISGSGSGVISGQELFIIVAFVWIILIGTVLTVLKRIHSIAPMEVVRYG